MQKRYELIDHTADFGIKAYGTGAKDLFSNAAFGMFSIIAELDKVRPKERVRIELEDDNLEELLVSWLKELLYNFSTKSMLYSNFIVDKVSERAILAFAEGEPYDPSRHEIKNELKAVTYHGLSIETKGNEYSARVIFDV